MKIAAVTDDGKTISAHFGRAVKYAVLTVEDGAVTLREIREKVVSHQSGHRGHHGHHDDDEHHGRGLGVHAGEKHRRMFTAISDCHVILARGMGQGAHRGLRQIGIQPILTDIKEIDHAVQAVIDGSIVDHPERLH